MHLLWNQTIEALSELISAGNLWDSAVTEAMSIVEKDEQKCADSPSRLIT